MLLIIKSIICVIVLSVITAQTLFHHHEFHDDDALIIDPLELKLNSTDKEGIFYCNSRMNISQQQSQLVVTIDNRTLNKPTFRLRTELINQTTIRIVVNPNGYIGLNRISCHWDNNMTYGQTADLIIASNPGVIILKEPCRAYDRRYVECTLDAPIIARAFENDFPRLYHFRELSQGTPSYRYPPNLTNIINASRLVFHFEPFDRNDIPSQVAVQVNMTLSRFGSSVYQFNIKPIHTTKVSFRIDDISNKKLTIRIDHNNTGENKQRLCSGHVTQIDDQKTLTAVQDIPETTEQTISIDRLRTKTKYKICLRCFYERSDESFNHEECRDSETLTGDTRWIILLIIAMAVIIIIVLGSLCITSASLRNKCCGKKTSKGGEPKELVHHFERDPTENRYDDEQTTLPLVPSESTPDLHSSDDRIEVSQDEDEASSKYQHLQVREIMQRIADNHQVSPDTMDLSS